MAKSKGWIKLDRSIRDSWIWRADEKFSKAQAWIDLLLRASHEDKSGFMRGQLIGVRHGSFITSIGKLATDWNWNPKTVRTFLRTLEGDGMVTTERTTQWTRITIVNCDKFQNQGQTERTAKGSAEGTAERTADWSAERTQSRNIKNYKETKNARARDSRNMIGQFNLSPGMRNDYSDMIADLERANEERNRQERLSGGSWEDGSAEWDEEVEA